MSLFAFLLLIVVGVLLQQYTLRHGLDEITYDIQSDHHCVECDETFQLITSVANNKRLPVFFLRLSELVPRQMIVDTSEKGIVHREVGSSVNSNTSAIEQVLYVMPYQKVSRALNVSLPARGRYLLRGVVITAGDLLGIKDSTMRKDMAREIIVYPRRADIHKVEHAFGGYLGEVSVRRFIMPDPIETVGFREYTGREPQRDISWTQTLRKNQLMVKLYDFTAEQRAALILDIANSSEDEVERSYEVTRSICEYLENHRIRFSFYTNARMTAVNGIWSYVPDGLGSMHLNTILEGLGRAEHDSYCSTNRLLRNATMGKDDGRSYILITAHPETRQEVIRRYERQLGQRIFIINVNDIGGEA